MVGCFRRDCEGRKKLPGSCFTTTSGSTFTLTAACKKKGNHCLEKRRSQSEKVKGRIEKVPNELVTISHKREVLKESKSPLKTERYLRIYLFLLHASFWLHFLFHQNSLGAHRVRVQIWKNISLHNLHLPKICLKCHDWLMIDYSELIFMH